MSEESENKDDLISNFCSITGVEPSRGQFYLESTNWDLQIAIQSFFEHTDDTVGDITPIEDITPSPHNLAQILSSDTIGDESDEEMATNESPKTAKKEVKKETKRSNFATLDSLRQRHDSGQSSEEEGQAFYAGGSVRSGQQVLGPKKVKNSDELVSNMFKSAKEHGAEVVDQTEDQKKKKGMKSFVGSGFTLGSKSEESKQISSSSSKSKPENKEMILKLWRNGFSVDDGQLREYNDPNNKEFLNSIQNGEIPRELVREANGQEVHLNMEDHRTEEFVLKKRQVQAFAGEGYRLGTPAADLVTSLIKQNSNSLTNSEDEARSRLNADTTQPITNIQIRLSDGTRLVIKINLHQTIANIREYICTARPLYNGTQFVLMTTFPNKELTDESLTIKDANLSNASIVQKLK